jgi:uncharacterized protein involved in outer membrane biogenesis
MHLILRIISWSVAVLLVLTAGLFLYLRNADLNVYETQIENALSAAIGHDVDFNGLFELKFGWVTTVTAENISLTNLNFPDDGRIVHVDKFFVAVNTWSTIARPVIIEKLEIFGAQVQLAKDQQGVGNWQLPVASQSLDEGAEIELNSVVFREAKVTNLEFSYIDPARPIPVNAVITSVVVTPDSDSMLVLDLDGIANDYALTADGGIGPLNNLINGRDIAADLDLGLGDLRLSVDGFVSDLRSLAGVDATLTLEGPAIEKVIDRFGLPPFADGPFSLSGGISRENGVQLFALKGNIGAIEIDTEGRTDSFVDPEVVAVRYLLAGPESAYVAELFGIEDATRAAFRIAGGFEKNRLRYDVNALEIDLGDGRIRADGWFETVGSIPNMDIQIQGAGPNLAVFGPLIRRDGIPAEPFDISGRIQKAGESWQIDDLRAEVGQFVATAAGRIVDGDSAANQVRFRATGPDLSAFSEITGVPGLPGRPFDISASLRDGRNGIDVEEAIAIVGDNRVESSGVLNLDDDLAGTDLQIRASGPDLSGIAALPDIQNLPAGNFDMGGLLRIDSGRLNFVDFSGRAGGVSAKANGFVARNIEQKQFEIDFEVDGPDLVAVLPYAPLDRLVGTAYRISGSVKGIGSKLALSEIQATVGNLELAANANIDTSRPLLSDDISLSASAPDNRILGMLTGLDSLPDGAVRFTGTLETTEDSYSLRNNSLRIGELQIAVNGKVGKSRPYSGNDISFIATGPSFEDVGRSFGYDYLSPVPFDLQANLDGTESGFDLSELNFTVGKSDINGSMSADFSGYVPHVEAKFHSALLNLQTRRRAPEEASIAEGGADADPDTNTVESATGQPRSRVFSDEPMNLDWLQLVDADVRFEADKLLVRTGELTNFKLTLSLHDGSLVLDPVELDSLQGGARAMLQLLQERDTYVADISLSVVDIRPPMFAAEDLSPETVPPVDVDFRLRGEGRSPHEIVGSSNGHLFMYVEAGQIGVYGSGFFASDLLLGIANAINPVSQQRSFTAFDCGVVDIDIKDGKAALINAAVQTKQLAILSAGSIDLNSERLNLTVRSKPREGIGLPSVANLINPYVKVAGTLLRPALEIDPAGTVTAAGAAVATGGLSVLARGLWDRVTGGADMCKNIPRERPQR